MPERTEKEQPELPPDVSWVTFETVRDGGGFGYGLLMLGVIIFAVAAIFWLAGVGAGAH